MSATLPLPTSLRARLNALQRRIRLLRAVRGIGLLVVVLALSAALALLADYALELPPSVRRMLFHLWLGEGAIVLLLSVFVPLCRRMDALALAAAVEERYPDLGERLTSAVELAGTSETGHGSPLFIGLLVEETAERSQALDFRPAVPARRAAVLTFLALAALALLAAPALVWPRHYHERTQRFLEPGTVAPAAPPFDLTVSPGDVVAARGRSVTFAAHLTPRRKQIALPEAVTLVVESNGNLTRQAMPGDGTGDYTLVYTLAEDMTYRIEAGDAVSDSYRATAIVPVELAAESPCLTIVPPQYARSVREEETVRGLVDLAPLQYSEIRFEFRFTRPAVAAAIEWITPGRTNENGTSALTENSERQNLVLSEDRRTASLTITAIEEVKYRLILEAEYEIRTELAGGLLRVQRDQPPSVVRFSGKEELRSVLPTDRIPLEIETADDIGVAGIELEYRVNEGENERQPLDLEGGNTPSAVARHTLELTGKLQENDRLLYRFRIQDNLPSKYKGPHVVLYPADRWLTLQAARRNDTLKDQEILAQRDEIRRRLQSIREALLREKRGVYKVRQETRDQASLPFEQRENVQQLQRDNRDSEKALHAAAEIAAATPPLQPLAEEARAVAEQEMHQSEQALKQAPQEQAAAERTRRFDKADEQLDSAVKRLDALMKANERLAQERLDRGKLEKLAEREKRLAQQAADLAAKPRRDAEAAEKLQREQAQVAEELQRLSQQSEPLKQALEQARQEQARQLAERARALAEAQRDLARAEEESERKRRAEQLGALAQKQRELAEKLDKLSQQTRAALPVVQTQPLKPEESRNAAEALQQGNTPEALRHQEQTAHDLERLAQAFERASQAASDPKEAARQLEEAEKALHQRVADEAAKKDGKLLRDRLQPMRAEQKAIRQAAERLSVPPDHTEAKRLKQQIAQRAQQAEEALENQETATAQARMEEAKDLLHRLSEMLPNLQQRRQQARRAVERLRRQQEEIARQVEPLPQDEAEAKRRLAEAARRQAETRDSLDKMDAPNAEERRERTAEALQRAQADLAEGRRADVAASQQEAKRQLERLEQVLRGEKSAEERARELARQQHELAQEMSRGGEANAPQRKQERQRQQQQIAEQTRGLSASEAPQRQREAAEATQQAAQAAQNDPASAETQKQMEEATRKLDTLARQMSGEESEAARAERLASAQTEAAAEAERQAGKPPSSEAQRRQQEIASEARQLRGGDKAQGAKQRVLETLARSSQAPASEQARAQRQAADALRDLADQLAGRSNSAAKAHHLAQQQRALAREAAAMEPGKTTPQDAQRAAERQAELSRQLRRVPAQAALPQLLETRARMADAAVALARAKSPADAKQALARAADSAEKLAAKLGPAPLAGANSDTQSPVSSKPAMPDATTPSGLPNRQQSEQARQLAQEQRQLREAVQLAAQSTNAPSRPLDENPVEDLVRQQREVAKQSADLAKNVAEEQGEKTPVARLAAQANQASQDAAKQMSAGALPQAQRAGQQSAERLRQLASQLATMPGNSDKQTPDVLQQARQLSQRQEQINRLLQPLANDARAQAAQQQSRQSQLQQEAGELARQSQQEAQKAGASSALQQAGENSRQAQQAMQQAGEQAQRGEASAARQAQERAAQALEQAARTLAAVGKPSPTQAASSKSNSGKAGQAMTQAAQQMAAAQGQLAQGKPGQAQSAMQQAAQALSQAAQQMAAAEQPSSNSSSQSSHSTASNAQGKQPGGLPDLSVYGLDAATTTAKSWGELPGELRTKIVQDLRANYGDDYARLIKYYFEHLADTKKK